MESGPALIEFGLMLLTAAISAGIGQFATGYSRGGCPVAFVAGFLGAYGGPRIAEWLEYPEPVTLPLGPVEFPVLTSFAGALILVLLVNVLTHRRKF